MSATYDAYSFFQSNPDKTSHSIKFSRRVGAKTNKLRGTANRKNKKFRFEKGEGGSLGSFRTFGDTATLTGTIYNNAGQGFDVSINFTLAKKPGVYKKKKGVSRKDWSYYKMTSGSLTSLTEGLASFDLFQKGKKRKGRKYRKLAVQMGTGANVTNTGLMGLFTQFRAKEQDCTGSKKKCEHFNGNLKLLLQESQDEEINQLTAARLLDDGDDGIGAVVPLPAAMAMLPAALGVLGVAGGVARRRRKS